MTSMIVVRKCTIAAITALALAACTTQEQQRGATGAVVGGVGGALIGQAVGGDTESTLIGAAVGATAGALLGAATTPGQCRYRDAYGREYIAACPDGYRY